LVVRIANAAGFLGDNLDAPRLLVEAAEVDYLTLEYLAELTLSILARAREKNPAAGYAGDFLDVLRSLVPALSQQHQLHIVTNAGGVNPLACAQRVAEILATSGMPDMLIGVVTGDDLLPRLHDLQAAGCDFANLDTGQPLAELQQPVVCANAYLGAAPIAEALARGARLIITGRVADASLTVGPAMHAFNWKWDDWNHLAAASVAGHLIECGAQVTGGYSTNWQDRHLADVGYPIAHLQSDGQCIITKPDGTGGVVNRQTVIEQLVYEIGDPAHYVTPDVDVDFTTIEVEQSGIDRVTVRGATGHPAPDAYKVSLAYRDGYTASGQLLVFGPECVRKAHACAEMMFQRVERAGYRLARTYVECLGAGDAVPGLPQQARIEQQQSSLAVPVPEVVMRVSVQDPRREAVERFTKEFAPLITSGPAGLAGYASGRSAVRQVLAYWPTTVPKHAVVAHVEVRPSRRWFSVA
jgi:hypothetical protein